MTNLETITDYQKQALDFLAAANAQIEVKYFKTGKHFYDDKDERDIYKVTLSCKGRKFTFDFGQSINASGEYKLKHRRIIDKVGRNFCDLMTAKKLKAEFRYLFTPNELSNFIVKNKDYEMPNAYDVLCALTKYDPGSFENFCSDYGYDTDSRRAENTYKAVQNEYTQLCTLFTDTELELMQEIQ
jgi:hypothetical protein